jgi:hypothetical protein
MRGKNKIIEYILILYLIFKESFKFYFFDFKKKRVRWSLGGNLTHSKWFSLYWGWAWKIKNNAYNISHRSAPKCPFLRYLGPHPTAATFFFFLLANPTASAGLPILNPSVLRLLPFSYRRPRSRNLAPALVPARSRS